MLTVFTDLTARIIKKKIQRTAYATVMQRRQRMNIRTEGEIKAYVEGYTKCYNDFTEYLKGRKDIEYAIRKMNVLLAAVKAVLEQGADEK